MARPYFSDEQGVLSWLVSRDHKRVAVMFFAAVLLFTLIGGASGALLHIAHWTPDGLLDAQAYTQARTLHGLVMLFLVLLPGVYVPFGLFLIPLLLGAENFVFPRFNSAVVFIYVLGGSLVVSGAHGTGLGSLLLYEPYSIEAFMSDMLVLLGVFALGVALMMFSVNVLLTIHKHWGAMRRRGHVPHFVWRSTRPRSGICSRGRWCVFWCQSPTTV